MGSAKPHFVDRKYSVSFSLKFSLSALCVFFSFGALLVLLLNRRLGMGYLDDISTLNELQQRLPLIILSTAIFQAILWGVVLSLFSLFWSHAVSGPLVRLRNSLQLVIKGAPLSEITFRKNDQLHLLAKIFNEMHARLAERRNMFADYLREADQLIKEQKARVEKAELEKTGWDRGTLTALRDIYKRMILWRETH